MAKRRGDSSTTASGGGRARRADLRLGLGGALAGILLAALAVTGPALAGPARSGTAGQAAPRQPAIAGVPGAAGTAGTSAASSGAALQSATRQAERLLAGLRLPEGARNAASLPASLAHPYSSLGTSQQVHLVRRAALPTTAPAALQSYLAAHSPAGTTTSAKGWGGNAPGVTSLWSVTFEPRRLAAYVDEAALVVTIAAGDGGSVLRADAEVGYVQGHPADAVVPIEVPGAVVSRTTLGSTGSAEQVSLHRGSLLSAIVAAFDATETAPPGVVHCPASFGVLLHVSFPATADNAAITASEGNCLDIALEVGGKPGPTLRDSPGSLGGKLATLLAQALGYHSYDVWQPTTPKHPLPQAPPTQPTGAGAATGKQPE